MRARLTRVVIRSWTPAAALFAAAVTGLAVAQQPPAGGGASPQFNPPGSQMARGTASTPPGPLSNSPITPSSPGAKAVQDLLTRAATDVTTPGRASDLTSLLGSHDREHAGPVGDWSDVDKAIGDFQNAWQARFGLTFKIEDKTSLVFTAPLMDMPGLTPTTAPATGPAAAPPRPTVTLADPGGHSRTTIHLTHTPGANDSGGWKFDLPDTATAASVHDSLLRHLTAVTANQTRWPTDVDQAYVYVTQRLLSSLGDADDLGR